MLTLAFTLLTLSTITTSWTWVSFCLLSYHPQATPCRSIRRFDFPLISRLLLSTLILLYSVTVGSHKRLYASSVLPFHSHLSNASKIRIILNLHQISSTSTFPFIPCQSFLLRRATKRAWDSVQPTLHHPSPLENSTQPFYFQ